MDFTYGTAEKGEDSISVLSHFLGSPFIITLLLSENMKVNCGRKLFENRQPHSKGQQTYEIFF